MAEYLLIDDPRHLVPLDGLDPVAAVPLTDAGLTPYHAIKQSLPKLVPGSTAVVIGTGGIGHVAIQLLRALTSARVVALDVSEEKLRLARAVGAHEAVLSDAKAADAVRELTGGLGAEAVFDFVGVAPTVKTAGAVAAVEGDVTLVGGGRWSAARRLRRTAVRGVGRRRGLGHSRSELIEVLAWPAPGAVVHTETYSLDDAPLAYERLHQGKVNGRAVILPHGWPAEGARPVPVPVVPPWRRTYVDGAPL
ncbi:alcohol dehydrogenase OS=Streptomyces tendae OX=1932 GN=GUR47_22435 PE=3 SV=1 [Streptomyces tendae]